MGYLFHAAPSGAAISSRLRRCGRPVGLADLRPVLRDQANLFVPSFGVRDSDIAPSFWVPDRWLGMVRSASSGPRGQAAEPQRRRREDIARRMACGKRRLQVSGCQIDGLEWSGPRQADRKRDRAPAAPKARGNRAPDGVRKQGLGFPQTRSIRPAQHMAATGAEPRGVHQEEGFCVFCWPHPIRGAMSSLMRPKGRVAAGGRPVSLAPLRRLRRRS